MTLKPPTKFDLLENLNSIEYGFAKHFSKIQGELNSIVSAIKDLQIESEISELEIKEFVASLNSTNIDSFCKFINQYEQLDLILQAKNLYIKTMQEYMENHEVLNKYSTLFNEKYNELNVQIVSRDKLMKKEKDDISKRARFAANKKHEKKNNAKNEIRKIWATGKYSTKELCAEEEYAALGLSFSTARKALRNQ